MKSTRGESSLFVGKLAVGWIRGWWKTPRGRKRKDWSSTVQYSWIRTIREHGHLGIECQILTAEKCLVPEPTLSKYYLPGRVQEKKRLSYRLPCTLEPRVVMLCPLSLRAVAHGNFPLSQIRIAKPNENWPAVFHFFSSPSGQSSPTWTDTKS